MKKLDSDKPNLSSAPVFFGSAAILILVALVAAINQALTKPTIGFGACRLKTEVARTQEEQARGLSGRPTIPADFAMLFPFRNEQPYFWMRGMESSIDIIWVKDKKVVQIDAKLPADDGATQYSPSEPIDLVVEVASGRTAECGVNVGTKITGTWY